MHGRPGQHRPGRPLVGVPRGTIEERVRPVGEVAWVRVEARMRVPRPLRILAAWRPPLGEGKRLPHPAEAQIP